MSDIDTKEEIEQRMDEFAREYGQSEGGDPRRAEIANELSALCLMLDRLAATIHWGAWSTPFRLDQEEILTLPLIS